MAKYCVDRLNCLIIGGMSHGDKRASPPASQIDVEALVEDMKRRVEAAGKRWLPEVEEVLRSRDWKASAAYELRAEQLGLAAIRVIMVGVEGSMPARATAP